MSTIMDHSCKGQTLVDRIKLWGEIDPETPAFIFWGAAGRRVLTRWDVLDLSSRFAYRLKEIGIHPSDYVCIVLPNSPERVVVNYGVILAGTLSINGNLVRADGEDLLTILNSSKCKAIILDPDQKPGPWEICQNVSHVVHVRETYADIESEKIPYLKKILFCRAEGTEEGLLTSCRSEMEKYIYNDGVSTEICNIFSTSGSTGYSKLVPHTHDAVLTFGCTVSRAINAKPGSLVFNVSPLGWLGGFPATELFSGATRVAIDEFSGQIPDKPFLMWDIVCRENVDSVMMVPAIASILKDQKANRKDELILKVGFTGGQPIKKTHLQVMKEVAESFVITYGCTEVMLSTQLSLDTEDLEHYENFRVGKPFEGVKVKIVDRELNRVPEGTWGEILVQTPTLTSGYLGSSGAKENFLSDGWFRTGDVGLFDHNGDLFVKGRASNAIMHGAYTIFPEWLEGIFQSCPGVKEIAIVPVPDPVLHHEMCACIIPEDPGLTQDTFIKFCQAEMSLDQDSPMNVVPKFVLFFKLFPVTRNQKLDRISLAKLAREQLNL